MTKKPDVLKSVTFSERIKDRHQRWWIEHQKHPLKHLGGKLQGRDFVLNLGCKVPELYRLVDRIEDIPEFGALPQRFVLKPTKGWSAKNVFLMDEGINSLDGRSWTREAIIEQIKSDPVANQPGVKYIAEEYLINWDGKPGTPYDYKFYVFGAEIAFIHVIERNSGIDTAENRHWFITDSWDLITRRIVTTQKPQTILPAVPDCIDELLATARKIGAKLNMFMRIDMYATRRGAVFGEFTPQPHGGKGYTAWADEWLGSLWHGEEGVLP